MPLPGAGGAAAAPVVGPVCRQKPYVRTNLFDHDCKDVFEKLSEYYIIHPYAIAYKAAGAPEHDGYKPRRIVAVGHGDITQVHGSRKLPGCGIPWDHEWIRVVRGRVLAKRRNGQAVCRPSRNMRKGRSQQNA